MGIAIGLENDARGAHIGLVEIGVGHFDLAARGIDRIDPVILLVAIEKIHLVLDIGEPDPLILLVGMQAKDGPLADAIILQVARPA